MSAFYLSYLMAWHMVVHSIPYKPFYFLFIILFIIPLLLLIFIISVFSLFSPSQSSYRFVNFVDLFKNLLKKFFFYSISILFHSFPLLIFILSFLLLALGLIGTTFSRILRRKINSLIWGLFSFFNRHLQLYFSF